MFRSHTGNDHFRVESSDWTEPSRAEPSWVEKKLRRRKTGKRDKKQNKGAEGVWRSLWGSEGPKVLGGFWSLPKTCLLLGCTKSLARLLRAGLMEIPSPLIHAPPRLEQNQAPRSLELLHGLRCSCWFYRTAFISVTRSGQEGLTGEYQR